jgi:hypothetical protein
MRGKHIIIELSAIVRSELEKFAKTGKHSVKLVTWARIILELDEADGRKPLTQTQITKNLGVSRQTVNDAKKTFIGTKSISEFLQRKKHETPPIRELIAWETKRNTNQKGGDWHFTTDDARTKLKKLYPVVL